MTQSNYADALTNDVNNDNLSSTEIRADIDNTRQAVGEKIDQLQTRLDPNRLKQQAQETVQEMLTDTADSVTEYVRTHRDEMFSSLADAARRNPLPTALVGLGVGWLLLETMAGSKRHDDDRYEYERRNFAPRSPRSRYEGSTSRSRDPYGDRAYYERYDDPYFDEAYRATGYAANSEFQSEYDAGTEKQHGSNSVAKAASAVKNSVGDVGQEIKQRAGEVKDRIGEAVDDVRHQAGDMSQQTQQSMQRAGNQMERWQQQAGDQVDRWQHRARHEGQRRGKQVIHNLEDNPLTYGAVAFAAGAALALLLPQTRTENRVFGEARDQVMAKGQEAVESAKSHAQQVAAEVGPELEEKARQIVSDVKEAGKSVAQDAVDELRPVVDKVVSKSKDEARSAAQELGVNPDKLTGASSTSSSQSGNSPSSSTPAMKPTLDKPQGNIPNNN